VGEWLNRFCDRLRARADSNARARRVMRLRQRRKVKGHSSKGMQPAQSRPGIGTDVIAFRTVTSGLIDAARDIDVQRTSIDLALERCAHRFDAALIFRDARTR